jgi:hypothetical protein
VKLNDADTRRPARSKARFVFRLIFPAGELASTSALMVLETLIDSVALRGTCSKRKARIVWLASPLGKLMPSTVTPAYSEAIPRSDA